MVWLSIAVVVVVALAVVASVMWGKVWRLRRQKKLQAAQLDLERAESEQQRMEYIYESIHVIANAVADDQCPIIEGCIRLSVLLDNLSLDCDNRHRFSPIFEIYNATRHIPTHSRWKALPRKEQRRFEQDMLTLESEYQQSVKELMAYIKQHPFSKGVGVAIN